MNAQRIQQALAFFTQQGWTLDQSAGIVANLHAESGMRHDAVGDGGAAYGIAQWHSPRQAGFEALMGKSIKDSSFEEQLHWVHAELQGSERQAGKALGSCVTAASSGACVSKLYERPADRESEATKRAALAERILADYGSSPAPQQPEQSMAPLLFLPAILEMVPSLLGIFGKGDKGAKNEQAARIIVDAFKAAVPGAVNTEDAITRVQSDPALKAQVKATVMSDANVLGLIEVGGGVAAARTANLALMQGATKWWQLVLNPVFLVTLLTLPLVYMFAWGLMPFLAKVSSDVISQTMGTIIGLVLGSVMGFWMGQTYSAANKRSTDAPSQ